MATIHHQVSINAPVPTVYDKLSTPEAIGTWWDKQTAIQTDDGLVLQHDPGPEHGVVKLRVVDSIPNKRVEWQCISTHPKSSPASAWTNTHFIFELTESSDDGASTSTASSNHSTILDFRQVGYDEHNKFFGSNNFAWGQVLQNLKQVVESVRRKSSPDVDTVLVANFNEALRQANRYLGFGLFSSLLFFTLSLDPTAFAGANVQLPGGLPPLPVRYAQIALALVYWVMPFLTDFSLARANRIAIQLQRTNPELLRAAVTFPSIATTRVHGTRWIAALLPPILVGIAGWRNGVFSLSWKGISLLGLAVGPYLAIFVVRLRKAFGDLAPDHHGD